TGPGVLCEGGDQRHIGRPQGNRCDIGAFESTIPATPVTCTAALIHNGNFIATYGGFATGQGIRDAIAAAVDGDTIEIAGTCQGAGGGNVGGFVSLSTDNMFVVRKALTFVGGYNWYFQEPSDPVAHPTVLDAQGLGRIAGVSDTTTVKTVTFRNLQFINGNTAATEPGGAIFADRRNNIVISGCTFNSNKAYSSGAVSMAEGLNATTLSIDHSSFTGNSATTSSGGALVWGSSLSGANATISDSTFKSNTAGQNGGAIEYSPQLAGMQLTLTRVTFDSNSIPSFFSGAAMQVIGTGNVTITGCTFKNSSGGPALEIALNGTADITGTTFDGNTNGFLGTAIQASGVLSNPLTLNVTDSTFVNNVGTGTTGIAGISISNLATLNVTRSTFSGNTSSGQGGALNVGLGATAATIVDSTFSGNTASFGGAIMASAGTVLIKSTTFSGNQATSGGEGGTLGAIGTGVTVTLQNDILANSIVNGLPFDPTCHPISSAVFTSLGNNLSTDAAAGCGFIGTDLTNANAGLAVLADNGGPTKTHALLASSAALDAGSCSGLTVDQRNFSRPVGAACDIGSFERQAYSTTISAVQSATSSVVGEPVTFTATVTPSVPGTPTGTVTFGTLGTAPLAANGTATITAPFNAIVSSILISYNGDASYNASSVTLPHTVTPATSVINLLSVTPNSASSGTALTATFAIGVLAPGVAAASGGTITVSDGIESCTAIAPATSCQLTLHTLGARTLTATYSGDARLTASASAPLPHTVTPAIVPILTNILPYQDTANHRITNGQIVNVPLSQMSLVFNEAMNAPLSTSDPASVQNPANYLLVGDGGDGVISTTVCTAPSISDVVIRVDPIFYGSNTATLNLNGGTPIPDGKYRLLICPTIQDTLGNQLGPYTIDFSVDTTVPSVTLVNSVADTGDGVLAENEGTTVAITQLLLTFSEAVNTTDATNTASYRLVAAGPNRTIDSTDCTTGLLGDDVSIPIDTAAYNSTTHLVTLGINGGTLLPDSLYRLFVCGSSIHNPATTPMAADFVRNFAVDHNPPADPTSLASTTHPIGGWSRLNQITMQWSGATDTVAVAGYSIVFDGIAATVPDTTIDVPQTSDPHSTTSAVLPDGPQYYFHLRTCDLAGNCTSGLNRGPYMIDTTAPSIPTNVQSTSHQVNVASINPHIAMTWNASTDALSGVAGYSFAFNQTAAATCDQIMKQTG
ncbi:MAG: choice-of-anchor Q domain-containing protein, partial [Thermoanaerobaculia bacterium]